MRLRLKILLLALLPLVASLLLIAVAVRQQERELLQREHAAVQRAYMDARRDAIMPVFERGYGADAAIWFQRWRMFYMAVAELFGYADGEEWGVAHYLLAPRVAEPAA